MAKKKKLRGIALAKHLHGKRSENAKSTDMRKRAKKTIPPNKKGIKKWQKNPNKTDIYAVDTPKRCLKCGRVINSRWKNLCYKCHHEEQGDYNPKKLQKRFGGTK